MSTHFQKLWHPVVPRAGNYLLHLGEGDALEGGDVSGAVAEAGLVKILLGGEGGPRSPRKFFGVGSRKGPPRATSLFPQYKCLQSCLQRFQKGGGERSACSQGTHPRTTDLDVVCGPSAPGDAANRPEKGDPGIRRFCSMVEDCAPAFGRSFGGNAPPLAINNEPCEFDSGFPPPRDGMLGLRTAVYRGAGGCLLRPVSNAHIKITDSYKQEARETHNAASMKSSSLDIELIGTIPSGSSRRNRTKS